MWFFLDTADLEAIKKYAACGVIDGCTTNPTLIAEEGVSMEKRVKEILKVVNGPVSVEVISTDLKGMLNEARTYARWHRNVHVKVPMSFEGLAAVKQLSKERIKTNVTLVFSASQALMCAKAGATFVSPFIGRLDGISQDGMDLIAEIMEIFYNYKFETKVLVASVRHPRHVVDAARLGADIVTLPPDVFEQMLHHPMTDLGLQKFLSDWNKAQKKLGKSPKKLRK